MTLVPEAYRRGHNIDVRWELLRYIHVRGSRLCVLLA